MQTQVTNKMFGKELENKAVKPHVVKEQVKTTGNVNTKKETGSNTYPKKG